MTLEERYSILLEFVKKLSKGYSEEKLMLDSEMSFGNVDDVFRDGESHAEAYIGKDALKILKRIR